MFIRLTYMYITLCVYTFNIHVHYVMCVYVSSCEHVEFCTNVRVCKIRTMFFCIFVFFLWYFRILLLVNKRRNAFLGVLFFFSCLPLFKNECGGKYIYVKSCRSLTLKSLYRSYFPLSTYTKLNRNEDYCSNFFIASLFRMTGCSTTHKHHSIQFV